MDSTEEPPSVETSGAVLLQGFLQYFCMGIVFAQADKFWKRSAEDTIYLRSLVLVLVAGGCLQTALASYKVWVVTVRHRHWWSSSLYSSDLFINGILCAVCESFLVTRCWKMTKRSLWVLLTFMPLVATALAANFYLAVKSWGSIGMQPKYMDTLRISSWAFPCWVYTSLALDLAITITLSASLWKSRTGLNYLDKTLRNIIGITWESAALPCILMILAACLYFSAKHSAETRHLDLFFILSTSKFYTLGLLRTLNCRKKFREGMKSKEIGRQSLGSWLSNAETVIDQDENREHDDSEAGNRGGRSTTPTSPAMDLRERGINVRKVDFVLVN